MNIQPATFRKILLTAVIATVLGGICPSLAVAQLANINPIKDNTLYQYDPAEGDVSNALGQHFFAGETGMGELRRGVLAFDIAGNIPAGSTILGVTLSLNMSRTGSATPRIVELHKMLADWGEGTSVAPGEEGDGAPATTNDATWRHRFFDTIFWTTEGGDFSATVSGSQSVGAVGMYTWSSSQMRADVQSWLDDPASNFGWLVLGDESEIATAKRFDTRESASPPVLTIIYRPAGPRPTPTPRPRPSPDASCPRQRLRGPPLFLIRYSSCYDCSHCCRRRNLRCRWAIRKREGRAVNQSQRPQRFLKFNENTTRTPFLGLVSRSCSRSHLAASLPI